MIVEALSSFTADRFAEARWVRRRRKRTLQRANDETPRSPNYFHRSNAFSLPFSLLIPPSKLLYIPGMKAKAGPALFRPLLWRRSFSVTTTRRAINKIVPSAQEAIKDLKGSSMILVGGFGFSGVPNTLINAVRDRPDLRDFTVVSNNAGMPGVGLGEQPD